MAKRDNKTAFIGRVERQKQDDGKRQFEATRLESNMLSQLRHQNLLPPQHKDQIPPNSYQLANLIRWSGLSVNELSERLGIREKNAETVLRWTKPFNQKGIEHETGTKLIRPAAFQFLLILLGLLPAPTLRRVEPLLTREKLYYDGSNSFTLSAKIDYQSGDVKVYVESANPVENDGNPALTFNAEFMVDEDLDAIKVAGKFRKDECPWCVDVQDSNPLALSINEFLKDEVWPMAWQLQDFYTLKPEMFLRPQCMLSIYHPDFQVPEPIELIRFKRWLGATTADLAEIVWEIPKSLRYWASSKASEAITTCMEEIELLSDTEKEDKLRKTTLYKLIKNKKISPQGWYILTSAIGLAPKIQTIGRKEPSSSFERKFITKEIHGAPVEYYNISVSLGWTDTNKDNIYINYAFDTHKNKGAEKTVIVPVIKTENGDVKILGNIFEEGAPEKWEALFDYPNIDQELIGHMKKWFHFVVWKKVWQQVWHNDGSHPNKG